MISFAEDKAALAAGYNDADLLLKYDDIHTDDLELDMKYLALAFEKSGDEWCFAGIGDDGSAAVYMEKQSCNAQLSFTAYNSPPLFLA